MDETKQNILRPSINDRYRQNLKQAGSYQNYHQPQYQRPIQQIIYVENQRENNGIGTAGFVCAVLGVAFCWQIYAGPLFWLLGVIFSFIGVFKRPRSLAIAGLIISFIGIFLIIFLCVGVLAFVVAASGS